MVKIKFIHVWLRHELRYIYKIRLIRRFRLFQWIQPSDKTHLEVLAHIQWKMHEVYRKNFNVSKARESSGRQTVEGYDCLVHFVASSRPVSSWTPGIIGCESKGWMEEHNGLTSSVRTTYNSLKLFGMGWEWWQRERKSNWCWSLVCNHHSSTWAPCRSGGQDRTRVGPRNHQHNPSHNGQDPAFTTMKSTDPANNCPLL